jgi:hypothetical protein
LCNAGNREIIKIFVHEHGPSFPSGVSLIEAESRWREEPFLAAASGSAAEEPTAAPGLAAKEPTAAPGLAAEGLAAAGKPAAGNGAKRDFSGEGQTAVKSNRHKPNKKGAYGKKAKKAFGKEAKQVGSKKAAKGMGKQKNKNKMAKKQTKRKGVKAKKQKKGGKTELEFLKSLWGLGIEEE